MMMMAPWSLHRAQLETNPILPGTGLARLGRQVALHSGHQPRSLSALSVFPAHTHTADNTRDSRYSALARGAAAPNSKYPISKILSNNK